MKRYKPLRRPCRECNKMFNPRGRFCRLCNKCFVTNQTSWRRKRLKLIQLQGGKEHGNR